MSNDKVPKSWPIEALDVEPVSSTNAQAVSGPQHFVDDLDILLVDAAKGREASKEEKSKKK